MYTVEETFEEIVHVSGCKLYEDRTFHTSEGEYRIIIWEALAEKHGRDQVIFVTRVWLNGEWVNTHYNNTFDRARIVAQGYISVEPEY